jgi:hypothetical protein
MSDVALFTVTWADDRDVVNVEVFASADAATTRCDKLTYAGVYAVAAEQGMEIHP